MHSQIECLEALAAGKTLTNGRTFVHLDHHGMQIHTGYKSKHTGAYTFDSPQYWHIYKATPSITPTSNRTLWVALIFSVFLNSALYIAFTESQSEQATLQSCYTKLKTTYNKTEQQLETYQVTQQQLESLGATPEQAQTIIRASEVHGIDPK